MDPNTYKEGPTKTKDFKVVAAVQYKWSLQFSTGGQYSSVQVVTTVHFKWLLQSVVQLHT